ncbi:hypothetical protein V1517DRAFT_336511 [Lipomyces orientalis]|uniref:Uncharacterized protein n=1 Tax=Lipomyces orientalis TaxID=1233043 RepID=A0ACC3TUG5_9ASCO
MPDPHFYGVMRKRTKKGIRDHAQALAKSRKRLDAAQRKRRKAYETGERKTQREAEREQHTFGAAADDGRIEVRAESPPPPLTAKYPLRPHAPATHILFALLVLPAGTADSNYYRPMQSIMY